MTSLNYNSALTINEMKVRPALELLKQYGTDRAKDELSRNPVSRVADGITASFRAYRSYLIPGRDSHDAKLRDMAMVGAEVVKHLECLKVHGRYIGELPANLPRPEDYQNAFTFLLELMNSIETQAPDSDLFRNKYRSPDFAYGEWQALLADRFSPTLPAFIGALAGARRDSNGGRRKIMAPTYYKGWASVGAEVYSLVFDDGSRSRALAKSLRAKLSVLACPFNGHQHARSLVEDLSCTLLSEDDALALAGAGWNELHSDKILKALTYDPMFKVAGPRPGTVRTCAVEFNLSRLLKAEAAVNAEGKAEAARIRDEEAKAQALADRTRDAKAQLELLEKIKAGTVTAEELDAAGY
ncbi:hypothetical protein [Pseudomonas sp. RL_105y_Pfl2_101]|uniref:hypothetical protein n=1 Tax=Pseudomonas sp. RL_105y_Pfl2_101 TaxID=3088708 RepID=UPI0030D9B8EC